MNDFDPKAAAKKLLRGASLFPRGETSLKALRETPPTHFLSVLKRDRNTNAWDYVSMNPNTFELPDKGSLKLANFQDLFFSRAFLEPRPVLKAMEQPAGSVLLIDEIDKSDEEFEALLLEVLSDYQVTIPEIGTIGAQVPPIVILTSNNTRELGDALKRRCLHLFLDFPEDLAGVLARVPHAAKHVPYARRRIRPGPDIGIDPGVELGELREGCPDGLERVHHPLQKRRRRSPSIVLDVRLISRGDLHRLGELPKRDAGLRPEAPDFLTESRSHGPMLAYGCEWVKLLAPLRVHREPSSALRSCEETSNSPTIAPIRPRNRPVGRFRPCSQPSTVLGSTPRWRAGRHEKAPAAAGRPGAAGRA